MEEKKKLTSIKEVFRWELFFVSLCGGFMFDTNKYLRITYRLLILLISSYLASLYFDSYLPMLSKLVSKASVQNIRLFWFTFNVAWFGVQVGSFSTGVRYHNLFTLLLSKKFDARYLDWWELQQGKKIASLNEKSDADNSQCVACGRNNIALPVTHQFIKSSTNSSTTTNQDKDESSLNTNSSASSLTGSVSSRQALVSISESVDSNNEKRCYMKEMKQKFQQQQQQQPSQEFSLTNDYQASLGLKVSRTRLASRLYIGFILVTALIGVLHDEAGPRRHHRYERHSSELQRLQTNQLNGTANTGLFLLLAGKLDSNHLSNNNNNNTNSSPHLESTTTTTLTTMTTTSSIDDKSKQFEQRQQLTNTLNTWLDGSYNYSNNRSLLHLMTEFARLLCQFFIQLILISFHLNQVYGQIFVTWMITSTITDMIRNSNLQLARESKKCLDCCAKQVGASGGGQRRALLQTTELLIQARDILLALRDIMSFNYLVVLIFDLSRLMCAFCIFSALISTDRFTLTVLLFVEYFRIAIGTLLTRLGYHDLHSQVRRIRVANERRLIELAVSAHSMALAPNNNNNQAPSVSNRSSLSNDQLPLLATQRSYQHHQATSTSIPTSNNDNNNNNISSSSSRRSDCQGCVTRAEAITCFRLARDIEELWPTTWFKPDLRSYVSQNAFVVTFVATLQQLVEASAKVEIQGKMQSKTFDT